VKFGKNLGKIKIMHPKTFDLLRLRFYLLLLTLTYYNNICRSGDKSCTKKKPKRIRSTPNRKKRNCDLAED